MLLPTVCPACGTPGAAPCDSCRSLIRLAGPGVPPPGLDSFAALMLYEGTGRELVARLKYRNARSTVAWLADGMAALAPPGAVDAVTWVPTTPSRRRERGFDQGRVLAKAVATRLQRPCRPLLRRGEGPPQTGRSRGERLQGPALRARSGRRPQARVLLVDDVVTTGATLAAAAAVLRAAGSSAVHAVAAAQRSRRSPT